MKDLREALKTELEDLKRMRDEMRVQAALAKAEARDAYYRLEARWPEVEGKMRELEKESATALDDLAGATRELFGEVREEYKKIREKGLKN